MSRWNEQSAIPPTPRTKSRGWLYAGLLLAAAGVGWYVLAPRDAEPRHALPESDPS